ncbi:MAG: amidohydrolase [Methylocystis sp.]|nr:amidohydrolase [Methylocystis sp.]MCA3583893.1 amidohydrolase [Methylocystis sp.]MCA3588452.1 amidohydrolase [Methylocystis sp.]MCA3592397.1 amidohydrolase [Methylocystis sp.]
MPIINRVAEFAEEIAAWRRHIHENPELGYEEHQTAAFVAEKLKSFGVDEIVTGIGRTGVVAVIKGRKTTSGKVVGMRADMDALPLHEATDVAYKSKTPGKMHACGHDGHTAMLLGAAKYLAETRNFDGTAVMIFQPAEEGGGGGLAMCEDGLMERFGIQEVYGMHNMPGIPLGAFAIRSGPTMAAADRFDFIVEGKGGHAARPHDCIDPVVASAQLVLALQTIASRGVDPLDSVVVSVCDVKAGDAYNVIPQTAHLRGTVRTLKAETRLYTEKRIKDIAAGIALATGTRITVDYQLGYPVTVNHPDQTDFAAKVAAGIAGAGQVDRSIEPLMGAEDFSYMLEERPGAFIFIGNGDTAGVHNPGYDFNDNAIPMGVSYWVKVAETAMAA